MISQAVDSLAVTLARTQPIHCRVSRPDQSAHLPPNEINTHLSPKRLRALRGTRRYASLDTNYDPEPLSNAMPIDGDRSAEQ